ncbi:MAG: ferrous iron transport protein A [Gammaproteobacteria bacterium]
MKLSALHKGDKGKITGIAKSNTPYRQKLLALGLLPGTSFIINRIAPLGDPIELLVRGFHLSLRKHEAEILSVELTSRD